MQKTFLDASRALQSGATANAIEAAAAVRNLDGVLAAVPIDELVEIIPNIEAQISTIMTNSGNGSAGLLGDFGISASFDMTNPRAVRWAETRAANLVTGVSTETRLAIRDLVARSFTEGIPPRELAREILGAGLLGDLEGTAGLTRIQTTAVHNLRRTLTEQGLNPRRIDELVGRQAKRFHRQRALNISRTETINASNQGQQELWLQARDERLISTQTRRAWIVTPDDRLDEIICAPIPGMNSGGVGLEEAFSTPAGPLMTPTAHPGCRCATRLIKETVNL